MHLLAWLSLGLGLLGCLMGGVQAQHCDTVPRYYDRQCYCFFFNEHDFNGAAGFCRDHWGGLASFGPYIPPQISDYLQQWASKDVWIQGYLNCPAPSREPGTEEIRAGTIGCYAITYYSVFTRAEGRYCYDYLPLLCVRPGPCPP